MEDLEDIYSQVVPLAYDMRVVFRPSKMRQPGTVRALFLLKMHDGTDEEAGERHVSAEFVRLAPGALQAELQRSADELIAALSR